MPPRKTRGATTENTNTNGPNTGGGDGSASGPSRAELLDMTTRIVAAYAGHNEVRSGDELAALITSVHATLARQTRPAPAQRAAEAEAPRKAAIPINKSVTPDYLVCLEDGKRLKMLKRHLRATYGMTPAQYRAKWGLSPDYPMVAPNYAAERSAFAKKIGLGRNAGGNSGDSGGRTAH